MGKKYLDGVQQVELSGSIVEEITAMTISTQLVLAGSTKSTTFNDLSNYSEITCNVDGGTTQSALLIAAVYRMPPNGTANMFVENVIDQAGISAATGTAINYKHKGVYMQLQLTNKAATDKTMTMKVFGWKRRG